MQSPGRECLHSCRQAYSMTAYGRDPDEWSVTPASAGSVKAGQPQAVRARVGVVGAVGAVQGRQIASRFDSHTKAPLMPRDREPVLGASVSSLARKVPDRFRLLVYVHDSRACSSDLDSICRIAAGSPCDCWPGWPAKGSSHAMVIDAQRGANLPR